MTEHVITTWEMVKAIPDYQIVAGKILFTKIFEIAPGSHKLFTFGQTYDVPTDAMFHEKKMIAHFKSLFGMISCAVSLLKENEINQLISSLQSLGARHATYGIESVHYPIVGEALLYTLETALGEDVFTSDVKEAWIQVYTVISKSMLEGAAEEAAANTTTTETTATATTVVATKAMAAVKTDA